MFRFYIIIIAVVGHELLFQYSIEDAFQGQDAIIEDDAIEDDSSDLKQQAEALLMDQSPLIEQMLALATSIGDGGLDSQMIMMIDDASPTNEQLEQLPVVETQKPTHQYQSEYIAQAEFFIGALIVFASFPLLLNAEQRKFKLYMIMQDVQELESQKELIHIQGSTRVREDLIDPLIGLRVNALRLYRKVEELFTTPSGKKWIEREAEIEWFDAGEDFEVHQSMWTSKIYNNQCTIQNFQINENQLQKLDQWVKIPLKQNQYPEYEIENGNIYISTHIKISVLSYQSQYWYIPSQLLTIVCKQYANQLSPIEIHIPIISSYDSGVSSTRDCQEQVCERVCQWINWGEWSQDVQVIDYIYEGLLSLEECFRRQMRPIQSVRLLAFGLMFTGICLFFLPIYQVLQLFPVIGELNIGQGVCALVAFIFATVFMLFTIGVSYWQEFYILESFYDQKRGIVLITLALTICTALIISSHKDYQLDQEAINDWFNDHLSYYE